MKSVSSGSVIGILHFYVLVALIRSTETAKECQAPTIPANAELHQRSQQKQLYKNGETLYYRCLPGFFQTGFPTQECRQGKWKTSSFKCIKRSKTCGGPGVVRNGNNWVTSNSPGGKAFYSCKAGYKLHGTNTRMCRQNMTWSGRKPECKEIDCGPLARPSNGMKVRDTGSAWKGKVEFKCTKRRRYVLSGSRIRTCLSTGKWSGETTHCRAPCSNPGSPTGGTKTGRNHRHGGKVSFSCPRTHRLQGDKASTCFDGKWSSKRPSCAVRGSHNDFTVCGIISVKRQRRMTNSGHSTHGGWPWQIGLHRRVNGSDTFLCGGALISNRWVITAAHCFVNQAEDGSVRLQQFLPELYAIKAGDHNMSQNESTEQKVRLEKIIIHPNYKDGLYENDIALLKLQWSVELNKHVRLLCLPRKHKNGTTEDLAKPGNSGSVAGWGATQVLGLRQAPSGDSKVSQMLRHASFKVQHNGLCRSTTSYHFNSSVSFCAGSENSGVGVCQGDSGGHFVMDTKRGGRRKWVSAGLVSWGEGCGLVGRYGYYTRLAPYVEWINQTMKRARPPKKGAKGGNKSF